MVNVFSIIETGGRKYQIRIVLMA